MKRLLVAATLACCACHPWSTVVRDSGNTIHGHSRLQLQPLSFEGAIVDGSPVDQWLAEQDADWKREWPKDIAAASSHFAASLQEWAGFLLGLGEPDPSGRPALTLRPRVVELSTGGYRPLKLTVAVAVVDASGRTLEEVTTHADFGRPDVFENRLRVVADDLGHNVAEWLLWRVKR